MNILWQKMILPMFKEIDDGEIVDIAVGIGGEINAYFENVFQVLRFQRAAKVSKTAAITMKTILFKDF